MACHRAGRRLSYPRDSATAGSAWHRTL